MQHIRSFITANMELPRFTCNRGRSPSVYILRDSIWLISDGDYYDTDFVLLMLYINIMLAGESRLDVICSLNEETAGDPHDIHNHRGTKIIILTLFV